MTLTLTAGTSPTQGSVQAKDANLAPAGTLGVVSYPQKSLKVALRVVHEDDWLSSSGAAGSVDAVRSFLNQSVYNQAVLEWSQVVMLTPMTVNFDLNRDGLLDTSGQMTPEMQRIVDLCKDDQYDYNIFLVDRPSQGEGGSMGTPAKYGFVHADVYAAVPCSPARGVAHELGHGAFSFPDRTGEGANIMNAGYYPCENRRHLEKNQWDDIHR